MAAHRRDVNTLLRRASELARADAPRQVDRSGADLIGADLRGADLRGASLTRADLTGANLRDADVRGADLARSIFLIQSQLDGSTGDGTTTVPPSLRRPERWPTALP